MIYFVDEDWPKYDAWIEELRFRGYSVKPCDNADQAFNILMRATDVEIAILDVMLSATPGGSAQFSRARTQDYFRTGLSLLDDLSDQRPDVFPRHAALLTNTVNHETLAAARKSASDYGIELLEKMEILSPFDFGDQIEALVVQANPGGT